MSGARERILSRVRDALAPLPRRAPLPDWDDAALERRREAPPHADLWRLFSERFSAVDGVPLAGAADLAVLLRRNGWLHGYCDPRLWPLFAPSLPAPFRVDTEHNRQALFGYDFGITEAFGAIAETGSLILTDGGTSSRLAALAPWVHVAVVERGRIVADLQAALAAHPSDPNIIWVTGPSRTGDVEGILIEGVHGPGVQAAMLRPGGP